MRTSAEAALVLALARGETSDSLDSPAASTDAHRSIAHGIDWARFLALAELHQVAPLIGWRTRSAARDDDFAGRLPSFVRDRLLAAYLHHRLRNESLRRDLTDLHTAFRAVGASVLFFKGPWLAFRAYPDPGTRPVGDIDACISEADYAAALDATRRCGYTSNRSPPATADEAVYQAHYRQQLRFFCPGRVPLELHFRLIPLGPPGPPESWLWETARDLPLGSTTVRVPGAASMLLQLVLHANQHAFARLRLLHDIARALGAGSAQASGANCAPSPCADDAALDSERFLAEIRRLHCPAMAYHSLRLARQLAGADVPDVWLKRLRPSLLRRALFSATWRLPAAERLDIEQRAIEVEMPLLFLLEMGSARQKASYAREIVAAAGGWRVFARRAWGIMRNKRTA